jgi:hypothetical protein
MSGKRCELVVDFQPPLARACDKLSRAAGHFPRIKTMSLKLEIADWRFEITWDGMLCTPLEGSEAKVEAESSISRHSRRSNNNRAASDRSRLKLAQSAGSARNLAMERRETR